ncbi:uncharacterized protein LOC131827419 isoform X2 [Mustela lutreola]|uniref:uncharacterized protein LOC131827419 isoform X2 n=1 Tax=Mustela lutreola TaxID=9666 RepID=UPI002797BF00|nr:uncharacterized protein LOC131827419 isoform X2 [Mustela lutreola]
MGGRLAFPALVSLPPPPPVLRRSLTLETSVKDSMRAGAPRRAGLALGPKTLLLPGSLCQGGTGPSGNAAGQVPARSHQPGLPILPRCPPAACASRTVLEG